MFKKRIGFSPVENKLTRSSSQGCPDIWELENGMFAIIGEDKTQELLPFLPSDASCAKEERIVVIDRQVLINAKRDIPAL